MVEIKPFKAVIYNFSKIHKLRKVICPPYDIITPTQAKSYRKLSSHNLIHLTLPQRMDKKNRYRVASYLFKNWLKGKILIKDNQPAIYFYQQEFMAKAKRLRRFGFIACLGLNDSSCIHGHEHTRIEPKEESEFSKTVIAQQSDFHFSCAPGFESFMSLITVFLTSWTFAREGYLYRDLIKPSLSSNQGDRPMSQLLVRVWNQTGLLVEERN